MGLPMQGRLQALVSFGFRYSLFPVPIHQTTPSPLSTKTSDVNAISFCFPGRRSALHLPDIVKSTLQLASDFKKNLSLISFLGQSVKPKCLEVVGCSNDLLLVCCERFYHTRERYCVCNPVTQEWIQLPPPPKRSELYIWKGFVCEPYFHFEPESETLTVNTHHRFRVLIGPESFEFKADICIFTSETGQWNSTVVYLPQCYQSFEFDFLFPTIDHGGKLYIKGRSNIFGGLRTVYPISDSDISVLVYDPFHGDNQFHVLPLPSHVDNQWRCTFYDTCLGICCEKLRFSGIYRLGLALIIGVWELKEEEEPCWHLVHKASLQCREIEIAATQLRLFSPTAWNQKQAFHPYDGDVLYIQHKCCVFLLNLRDNQVKKIEILRKDMKILPIDFQWWPTPIPSLPRQI
ncbi:hypothetical protein L6164_012832 [Bauhinia variegata]|uniref:Uncharacterized protein n=1 Tax=Bauhinia variegata TaxID=167791 RepID=A0ACB9PA93_BAUVA|nr:hypothetical protein L6164_012832 [Bauhinia variegata]